MTEFLLHWEEAGPPRKLIADAEHYRVFTHLGSAVAWARRKIKRGEVVGDCVELSWAVPYNSPSEFVITATGVRPQHTGADGGDLSKEENRIPKWALPWS